MEIAGNTVVVLTGAGAAAVAVIRVSGPLCGAFLRQHFSRIAPANRCVHGELRDGGKILDDVVVALAGDGRSADINLHGSPWTVWRAVELAKAFGFSPGGESGEPSLLAADGDDLIAREVAAWLPQARSEMGVRMLGAQIAAWERLRMSAPSAEQLRAMARDRALWRMLHAPRVAIVGRPNAGKSTLANRLFEAERSITAPVAGTTRDWVEEYAVIDGLPILLLDTPGIRETGEAVEAEAISAARGEIAGADLVLMLVDATEERESADIGTSRLIVVFNKCDLPNSLNPGEAGVRISARTGEGLSELRRAILAWFGCENLEINRVRWWTERQRKALEKGEMAVAHNQRTMS